MTMGVVVAFLSLFLQRHLIKQRLDTQEGEMISPPLFFAIQR
jgi:hypothetical protein